MAPVAFMSPASLGSVMLQFCCDVQEYFSNEPKLPEEVFCNVILSTSPYATENA
jgi:hypothetical protein